MITVGRRTGRYLAAALAVVVEKVVGIMALCLLFLGISPTALGYVVGQEETVFRARTAALGVVVAVPLALAAIALIRRSRILAIVSRAGERLATSAMAALGKGRGEGFLAGHTAEIPWLAAGRPVQWRAVAQLVLLTLATQFLAALAHHFFFSALAYPTPYAVNLCVVPMITVVMFLPISFGSIGMREAAFAVIYGMFGVPMETALLAAVLMTLARLVMDGTAGLIALLDR